MKDHLLAMFEYDLWANLRWVQALENLPFKERAEKILRHNIGCMRSWMETCYSDEDLPPETNDLAHDFATHHKCWADLIKICDIDAYANYERETKVEYHMIFEIASHVVNHGTYHRGHLRGLCEAEGVTEFPETDFVRYLREKSA
jgi:uncharacterized damage-inducible protein DinB